MADNDVKGNPNLQAQLTKKMAQIDFERREEEAKKNAERLGLKYVNLTAFPIDNNALFLVPEAEARGSNLVVITKTGSKLTVAVLDPNGPATKKVLDDLKIQNYSCNIVVASGGGLAKAWERYSLEKKTVALDQGIMAVSEEDVLKMQEQIQDLKDLQSRITSMPVTKIMDILMAGALKIGASDIHFEPEEDHIRIRYRLDGVLTDIVTFARSGYPSILSRIKLNSGLMINVHTAPQDGRFTIRLGKKDIEVRVSLLPGAYGENIVMRILDPSSIRQKLEDLGMRQDTLELAKKLLQKTSGTILTTGPTGSGKTTTLYAFVQHINTPDIKVITVEDPIEYHIKGISQTQVNVAAGYTFVGGLRSIVRQDPDVILIGEIRDKETAEIAMQAALTGHLVLSTIHTNSAAGTIPRLIDLGVRPVTIAPAINAAMAQRLVRRLCAGCKKKEVIHSDDLALIKKYLDSLSPNIPVEKVSATTELYYPQGCNDCNSTGYKGRVGVYEIFEIDSEMQKLILKSPALAEVQELAVKKGLTTLLQDAFIKVVGGFTSVEEVMRVIGE